MRPGNRMCVFLSVCLVSGAAIAWGQRTVDLSHNGEARAVIVVPEGMMSWEGDDREFRGRQYIHSQVKQEEDDRRLQRDSVRDLVHYLGRITGAEIEMVEERPRRDSRTPIYIGAAAEKVFGDVGLSKAGKFGFRVVVHRRGIGLYGESEVATSYAIYELLHRLGCRWYMPSEMGEVLPSTPTLSVPVMDEKLAPATEYRGMWGRQGDPDFFRRNRLNSGTRISAGHALSLNLKYWCAEEATHARHGEPMLEWKWQYNPGQEVDSLPWTATDYDDSGWPVTHVVRETWSTIGHHNTMTDIPSGRSGRMVYRAVQELNAAPAGKRVYLWIGSTDGSAKVFVNGKHIPYRVQQDSRRHQAGDEIDRFSGYCQATGTGFDITEALNPGANQFTILCERTILN